MLLIITAVLLTLAIIALVVDITRRSPQQTTKQLKEAIDEMGKATHHFTEVNMVVALLEGIQVNPDLRNNLGEYAGDIVIAAILVRMNSIGANIKAVEKVLADHEVSHARYGGYQDRIKRSREQLARMTGDLEALRLLAAKYAVPAPA